MEVVEGPLELTGSFKGLSATEGDDFAHAMALDGTCIPIYLKLFDSEHDGLTMLTDWRTLTAADPGLTPDPANSQYDVGLRPGTDRAAYTRALNERRRCKPAGS